MSNFKVIGAIGESLKNLLDNSAHWTDITKPEISLKSPKQLMNDSTITNTNKVSIFLYQIVENVYLKNQGPERINNSSFRNPPQAVDLLYLITPYASDPIQENYILGKVMQIFQDNSVLRGTALAGILGGTDEEFRLMFNSLSLDDLTKVWGDFQDVDYKLSVGYMISPVMIDSTYEENVTRVVSKEIDYYHGMPKRGKT